MINNMLKLNKKMVQNRNYYHTCPACRINIFNADFRIFFYIIEQAIKLMRFPRAENVLTEARVSGLRASVLRTLDGLECPTVLPRSALSLASRLLGRQGPFSSPLFSSWGGL